MLTFVFTGERIHFTMGRTILPELVRRKIKIAIFRYDSVRSLFKVTEQNRKLSMQIRLASSEIMAARMTWLRKGSKSKSTGIREWKIVYFIFVKKP